MVRRNNRNNPPSNYQSRDRRCLTCGGSIVGKVKKTTHCSNRCHFEARSEGKSVMLCCPNCKKFFHIFNSRIKKTVKGKVCCSIECRIAYDRISRAMEGMCSFKCKLCNKICVRKAAQIVNNTNHFCSKTCMDTFRRNSGAIDNKLLAPELLNNKASRKRARSRLEAMKKIDPNLKCRNCGCDVIVFLEINHKNLGGREEFRTFNGNSGAFYVKIKNGLRPVDDLELLCRVCNALHYVQMKGCLGHKVTYEKSEVPKVIA